MEVRNVINIVANTSDTNSGVWTAATVGNLALKKNGIQTFLWVTSGLANDPLVDIEVTSIEKYSAGGLHAFAAARGLLPQNTVIATHGCWLEPTRLGNMMAAYGYRWIYVPQGMLEPWSLGQNRLKKRLYFTLFERRFASKAVAVRAVSSNEQRNLKALLKRDIDLIENGVTVPAYVEKRNSPVQYVFIARLHPKKGITPLVKAWHSTMRNIDGRLIICGVDEGELPKIRSYIHGNIEYRNFVGGREKMTLLKESHYVILPSSSEGLPSGVLEAMSYGLIPIISEGCNLPEVFSSDLGFRIGTDELSISNILRSIKTAPFDHNRSKRNHDFIRENFSDENTGLRLLKLYRQLK